MSLFGKTEKCDCDQKRRRGTCVQCFNRLGAMVKKAEEQADIAGRMFADVNYANDVLKEKVEDLQSKLKDANEELGTVRKFRAGPTIN